MCTLLGKYYLYVESYFICIDIWPSGLVEGPLDSFKGGLNRLFSGVGLSPEHLLEINKRKGASSVKCSLLRRPLLTSLSVHSNKSERDRSSNLEAAAKPLDKKRGLRCVCHFTAMLS